ncbi:MAG: hypothetical protein WAM28_04195 [Chlamydiales bacterium]
MAKAGGVSPESPMNRPSFPRGEQVAKKEAHSYMVIQSKQNPPEKAKTMTATKSMSPYLRTRYPGRHKASLAKGSTKETGWISGRGTFPTFINSIKKTRIK